MEHLNIITNNVYSVYLFGSWLHSDNPKDIDVLIVYNPTICPPSKIQAMTRPFLEQLRRIFNLEVDTVYLTEKEEKDINFIKTERCISIDKFNKNNDLFREIDQNLTLYEQ